jgi:hypothetical protein
MYRFDPNDRDQGNDREEEFLLRAIVLRSDTRSSCLLCPDRDPTLLNYCLLCMLRFSPFFGVAVPRLCPLNVCSAPLLHSLNTCCCAPIVHP